MTETKEKTAGMGRGGRREGSGRKPIPNGVSVNLLLTPEQKDTLKKVGGRQWLRGTLDSLRLNALPKEALLIEGEAEGAFRIPFQDFSVQAGFPSPAESYAHDKVDLNKLLVDVPAATFLVKAAGDSMISAGIDDGDLLVLDRSKQARHGDIVIMRINDDFTVKRLFNKDGVLKLEPSSPDPVFKDIYPNEDDEWAVVGVVTYVIKHL